MEFRILGPLEVVDGGKALDLGGPKQRAILALLLLERNRVVSSDSLIEAVWDEEPPATAQKALQVYVSKLRKVLGKEQLETKAPGYTLHVGPEELDVARFERLQQDGRLREALALWRGRALPEFAYERFAQAEIERLEEVRRACLEERIERDLERGGGSELVGELEALVREHPLRERFREQLMLALYRSGRQAEALEAYQAARKALVEELGIEPGRSLRDLHQAILNQDPVLERSTTGEEVGVAAETARGAFVDREVEIEALLTGLADAFSGRGRLFLVAGEPGIGKSRLAEELARRARGRGARVLVGRSWEAGGAPAYWPWVQALRAYVRDRAAAELRDELGRGAPELVPLLPELRELFPDLPKPFAPESEGARFRLFESTAGFLVRASEARPLVIVLDDLHAADAPSLLLLRFVARVLASTRILVVCAYRDVDPTPRHPLTEMLAEIIREPVTRRLSLRGLRRQDVAAYVEAAASELASPALVSAVHEETEGNPLFVGEIVRLLSVEGVPPDSAAPVRLAIPDSVHDVIARRLSHLSEQCHRLLLLASVLGREFALTTLARLGTVSEDELLDTIDEAIAARVVSDVPGDPERLRFAHVLIRDTLYERIAAARRIRLHREVVEALEALYGDDPGPHLAELAHHAFRGTDVEKALLYANRAADRALALLAYEEAGRLYETALEALDLTRPSDEPARCELLLSLGAAEARAGNTSAADRALLEAAGIARRLGLSRELARAAAEYGGRKVWARGSDVPGLLPLLEEGLAGLGDQDVKLRARLLARLSGALRDDRSRDRRDALSREAVEHARRTGDPAALVEALDGRGMAILAPDTLAETIAVATELREVAERISDRERVVDGYMHRIAAQAVTGDVGAVQADLDAAEPLADELGQPAHQWDVAAVQAMLALAAGRLDEGEELAERALALGMRALPAGAIPVYEIQRYTLACFRGSADVEPIIRDLIAEHPTRPVFRCVLAHLHARLGRLPEARSALHELATDEFSGLPFDQGRFKLIVEDS